MSSFTFLSQACLPIVSDLRAFQTLEGQEDNEPVVGFKHECTVAVGQVLWRYGGELISRYYLANV
jgi:hypothetical protein